MRQKFRIHPLPQLQLFRTGQNVSKRLPNVRLFRPKLQAAQIHAVKTTSRQNPPCLRTNTFLELHHSLSRPLPCNRVFVLFYYEVTAGFFSNKIIMMMKNIFKFLTIIVIIASCATSPSSDVVKPRYLFPGDYMADPAAHVFNDRVYIYPSHDRRSGGYGGGGQDGGLYDMVDYHVFSLDDVFNGNVTHHGLALALADIPWARGQLWDNDVAYKDGKYYMYFPAKNQNNLFRIGVAIADKPEGPFVPQPEPIRGSYSIDPCVFEDDGSYYIYFGGLWGGQLEQYYNNVYTGAAGRINLPFAEADKAISPRAAKLSDDMLQFDESPREVIILDAKGIPLTRSDTGRRFFEASWMHKYNGVYYFSYSTGDTHQLCYATGSSPYGPFTYQGVILTPVTGWTTHHSIVEYKGKWYLFYHDARPSGGIDHLRSMKVTELIHLDDGSIQRMNGMR